MPRPTTKNCESLEDLLESMPHLNLTNQIEKKELAKNAHGAYCDMFIGYRKLEVAGPHSSHGISKLAIKCLRVHTFAELKTFEKMLAREISIWSRLDHPHILAFVGFSIDEFERPSLISEWMENGTIKQYVKNNIFCDLRPLVVGIAEGLAYLHSEKVVHGDMKAANILVSGSGQPQICDFGMSRIISASETLSRTSSHGAGGTMRWMAPEFFALEGNVTEHSDKTDIWAFGMTIYELLTGKIPYAHIAFDVLVIIPLVNKTLPPRPEEYDKWSLTYRRMWTVCEQCWNFSSSLRPSMATISRTLPEPPEELEPESCFRRILLDLQCFDLSDKITQFDDYRRDCGGFSDVYFGQSLVHNEWVAIKRFRYRLHDDLTFLKRMVRELQIWVRLTDKNILPLLGYTTDSENNTFSLITEWMSNRTVMHYMKSNEENSGKVLYMVKGIASGLSYLHSKDVIHSDMKSCNVLVSSEGEPLLTDFGISHILSSSSYIMPPTTGMYGTVRWMAYEQIHPEEGQTSIPHTVKTDVWSFGMTVLELLTLRMPYAYLVMDHLVTMSIYHGKLPARPEAYNTEWSEERKRLWAICKSCWNLDPNARPGIDAIKLELDDI